MERDKDDICGNTPPSKSRQDYDDLNNELAGRSTGRIARFLSEPNDPKSRTKRDEKEHAQLSRLMQMLQNDPEYAALYRGTMDKLQNAETATQEALENAEQHLEGAEQDLANMRDRASTMPDGTKVFRGKDGNVYTEDGRQLTDEERSQVDWKEGAPSYDKYAARKNDAAQARKDITDLQRYQTEVLGHIRDRMEDEINPPSKTELDGFQKDIESGVKVGIAVKLQADQTPSDAAPSKSAALAPPPIS